jgi:hypothetical protein
MKNKNEKIVYQGKIIEIVEKTIKVDGKELHFERARRAPGVRLIIETPEGNFILNKEKRHELKEVDFRLPGGKVFDYLKDYNNFLEQEGDINTKAKEAAELEAVQEVGIKPIEIEYLGTSHCGATIDWDLIYFVVKKYEKVERQTEEGEDIENIEISPEVLKEWALSGKIQEDRSVAVILKYLNNK